MDLFTDLTSAEKRIRQIADIKKIPIAGTFELTPLCNMDCRMCYVRMSKKELDCTGDRLRTAEEWIELGRQAVAEGMMFLLLTGGEPFLYPEFIKVYHELRNMGLVIMINSNGTLLTEEILDELKANKPRRINLSMYGSSNEVYADLCNNPHGFTQLMRAVDQFMDNGIDIRFNMAITPWNKDDFENMVKIALERNVPVSIANYIFPANRRDLTIEQSEKHRFSAELAGRYCMDILDFYKSEEEIFKIAKSKLETISKPINKPEIQPCGFWCRAGQSSFWTTWNHRIMACGMIQQPSVDYNHNFKDAWQSIRSKMQEIYLCSECYDCEKRGVCQTCAAAMLSEEGAFNVKPTYHCTMTDAMLDRCKEIVEERSYD